jgi:hypothetical protein
MVENLEVKIFALSNLLQEYLDETEGVTKFKNKTRFHIKGLQEQLTKLNTVVISEEEVSLLVSGAVNALEKSLDQ